jgi:cytochrome c-type biogenesis protein CcmH
VTAFIAIAAAMIVAALGWIIVPLLRRRESTGVSGDASNVSVLRDQLAELDADLANGTITREHYDLARRELEQRVLEDTSRATVDERSGPPPFAGAWTAAIVATALPIAAVLLYVTLGNHDAFAPAARVKADARQHDLSPEKVEEMIAKVVARLEKEPNNLEAWSVLAHTYYAMNRMPEAIRAFDRAVALEPNNANLLADYADAVAANQNSIEGKPLELITRALKADPTQWKALALAGTAAFDRKDFKLAVDYWEKLKASLPPQSEMLRSVDASIAEAKAAGGLDTAAAKAAAGPDTAAAKATAVPNTAPAKAAAGPDTAAGASAPPSRSAAIAGTVNLSTAFAAKTAPTDTVYIFARAAQGPKMPLAILRKQVKDLPVTFSLDDSMAMAPEMKLSNFDEVIVGARISRSGSATAQSGDFEGFSKPVKLGANSVAVVIDTARP